MSRPSAGSLPSLSPCTLGSSGKVGLAGGHCSPGCLGMSVQARENLASDQGQDDVPVILYLLGEKLCGSALCACVPLLL